MLSRWWLRNTALLVSLLFACLAGPVTTFAQADPVARDQVIAAAVEIALVAEVTVDGSTTSQLLPAGSGTIVSPDGLILTNWHVVNMASHRARMTTLEQQAGTSGQALAFGLEDQGVAILTSDGTTPPERAYLAELVAHDAALDLAVLKIVATFTDDGITASAPHVPFVPLGDTASISLGDPIHIYGYPAAGGDALTYTRGVISGFNFDAGQDDPAWITTDATLSGGSSGGTAVDADGRLIGVPTQGSALDCLPFDGVQDAQLDQQTVSCVPVGGSLGQLRPINLAMPLLETAGLELGETLPRQGLDKSAFPLRTGTPGGPQAATGD
jgi:serine protease Do